MFSVRRKQNILIGTVFFIPLCLQLAKLFVSSTTLFILETIVALILLLIIFFNDIVTFDQWFLERMTSWLSLSLGIINVLRLSHWIALEHSSFIFELATVCYACSLYFVERHFNIKNILIIILNLNILANYMTPAGDILILTISILGLIFYLERVLITHTDQLNLTILITYLIAILVSLIWFTPQVIDFDTYSFAWLFEAIGTLIVIPLAYFLLINREHLGFNTHIFLATLSYILITELAIIVAEPKTFNVSLVVILFLIYLSILNFLGNIHLSKSKKISIIMPVHDNAQTIVESLESIKKQTYREWEVVIVDTSLNNNTEIVVKRYLRYNELPVKYIKHKFKNQVEKINTALGYITGDICYILYPENVLFDSNVFYRATSALYGEKCDGIFIGIQEIDQQSRPKKIIHTKSYYDSQTAIAKIALDLGKNPYPNCIYWHRKIFETNVKNNYLINGLPAWYDEKSNKGLKVVNTNFIGLKYRINNNDFSNQKYDEDIQKLASELRMLNHILSYLTIPFFKYQSWYYRILNKLYLSSITPVLFWYGRTNLKNVLPKFVKRRMKNLDSPYLKAIVKFSENYNINKKKEVVIPENVKLFMNTEVITYHQYIRQNKLDKFYWKIMKIIGEGTATMLVAKKDKNKLEEILDFFTIKDYIKIEVKQ